MKRTEICLLSVVVAFQFGCSTICPEGIKFGPYATLCAPYELYKFAVSVHGELQPGGMLNPHGKKTDEKAVFNAYSSPPVQQSSSQ